MATADPRVDAYIEGAAAFAQPVLRALREAVHAGCPGANETIKWGMPFFTIDGRILAHMAAFTRHCAFGIWRGREVAPRGKEGEAMGQFGRIASAADLPPRRELVRRVELAAAAAARPAATKSTARAKASPPSLPLPEALATALHGHAAARAGFDNLSNSQRRDYVEWIVEARRDATRARRVAQAIEWLAEGKSRNWKYEAR